MPNSPRSSFIPKQTTSAVSSRVHNRRRFNVLGFVASVLLLSALVLAGGTYFFKGYVTEGLMYEKQRLADERGRFNESDIAAVRELDRQFKAAAYLLDRRMSVSKVFDALELHTKESVQFTGMTLSRLPSDDISISVQGATEEFTSVALQKLQFGADPIFKSAIFTELTSNAPLTPGDEVSREERAQAERPKINFVITGTVNQSVLAYEGVPEAEAVVETQPAQAPLETTEVEAEAETETTDEAEVQS